MKILSLAKAISLAVMMLGCGATQAQERRLALVIGNAGYQPALANSANDAKEMSATLRNLDFEVTELIDATAKEMHHAVLDFGEKLKKGVAAGLFYYAGHGLQVKGQNYLIPIDAKITNESSVRVEAVAVDLVTEQMVAIPNAVNMIILDACRDNPFERKVRGVSRGLSNIDAARGTMIAYATSPGSVAADGDGRNGVYTEELLRAMQQPGLKVEEVFKQVRVNVANRTKNRQIPWESSSLTGDFVFRPPGDARKITVQSGPLPTPPITSKSPPQVDPVEMAFWDSIKHSTYADDYDAYLEAFPTGRFVPLARTRASRYKAEKAD